MTAIHTAVMDTPAIPIRAILILVGFSARAPVGILVTTLVTILATERVTILALIQQMDGGILKLSVHLPV